MGFPSNYERVQLQLQAEEGRHGQNLMRMNPCMGKMSPVPDVTIQFSCRKLELGTNQMVGVMMMKIDLRYKKWLEV